MLKKSARCTQHEKCVITNSEGEEPPPVIEELLQKAGYTAVRIVGSSDLELNDLRFGQTAIGLTPTQLVLCSPDHGVNDVVVEVPLKKIERATVEYNGETVELVVSNGKELARVPATKAAKDSLRTAAEEINKVLGVEEDEPPRRLCQKCGKEIGFGQFCVDCVDKRALALRLLGYLKPWPESGLFVGTTLLLGIVTLFSLASPWIFKMLIDQVLPQKNWHLLVVIGAAMVGVRLGSIFVSALRNYWITLLGQRVTTRMKSETFAHVMRLSLGFFQKRSPGEIIYRINSDIGRLQDFMTGWAQDLLQQIIQVIIIGGLLFTLQPKLAWLVLIPVPIISFGAMVFGKKISRSYLSMWRLGTKLTSRVTDIIPGMRLVKTSGRESAECQVFDDLAESCVVATMSATKKSTKFYPSLSSLTAVVELTVLILGVTLIFHGHWKIGSLIAFLSYQSQFYAPVHGLVRINDRLIQAWTSAMRVFEVLDETPEIQDEEGAVDLDTATVKGRIEFRNVTFGYDPKKPVIRDFSFVLEPGESIGLVGKSGCGKSTLVALLLRAYDPQEGQILVDGIDVRNIKLQSLMKLFGVVLQEPFLFEGSIEENISYGCDRVSELDIIQAAQAAGAHHFIMSMPDGYDSLVGAHGSGLSGGQKQRLAIARAILRNPRILILDEATSALDSETEAQISSNIKALIKGRTCVAVAHRLSTLESMTNIMVLEDGKLIERGPASELRNNGGAFAHLSKLQGKPDSDAQPAPDELKIEQPGAFDIKLQPNGRITLTRDTEQVEDCFALPTLPFTAGEECLIELQREIPDSSQTESLVMLDPRLLTPQQRAVVSASIERRRFIPLVESVEKVAQNNTTDLHVQTNHGPALIRVTGSSAVKRQGQMTVVRDASGARFQVRPEALDPRSRDLVAGIF